MNKPQSQSYNQKYLITPMCQLHDWEVLREYKDLGQFFFEARDSSSPVLQKHHQFKAQTLGLFE